MGRGDNACRWPGWCGNQETSLFFTAQLTMTVISGCVCAKGRSKPVSEACIQYVVYLSVAVVPSL